MCVIFLCKGTRFSSHRRNVQERNVFHAYCMLYDCPLLIYVLLLWICGKCQVGRNYRVRPIVIQEPLKKKTFCFMIQHAASTELKQKAEAGLAGGYMSNMKVVSSYKRGQMSDDRVPQHQKNGLVPQIRNRTNSSSNFRVQVITDSWKHVFWFLGYSLLTLP